MGGRVEQMTTGSIRTRVALRSGQSLYDTRSTLVRPLALSFDMI